MDCSTTGPECAEQWLPVAGWPGYEISSLGRLGSWLKSPNEKGPPMSRRILVGGRDRDGYRRAVLVNGRARRSLKIHILVLEAFAGPRPFPKAVTRHLNGMSTDNRALNLSWGTQQENIHDRARHGRTLRGERHRLCHRV